MGTTFTLADGFDQTAIRTTSGSWDQTYSTVTANSSTWLTAVSGGIALVGTTVHLADPAIGTSIDETTIATDDRMLIWDESASSWKYVTIDNLQDEIDTGSGVTAVSGGIALVGTTAHLADPETLTQIAEADAVAADRMLIWDESVSSWKYITIEDLQDEIDTGGGSGEANENSFKTVTLSSRDTTIPHQSDIIADTTTDTLTLCAGPNIELIGDSTTDTITISARDVQGGSGGGISFDGSTANGVLTYKDSDEATVESNLTFDGSALTVAGTLSSQSTATLFGLHTTVHDYGTTANIDVDFDYASLQKVTLNGAPAIDTAAANKGAGKSIVIKILCDSSARAFTWNSSWVFIGEKPTSIAASKTALLSMTCFGTSESDVICSYAVQD